MLEQVFQICRANCATIKGLRIMKMQWHIFLAGIFLTASLHSQSLQPSYDVKTGGIQLIELDNGYKVWTKKVAGGTIPVLMLHGGPGCTHEYFECFEDFLPEAGYQIIYYDQLGSHFSDQPKDNSLWKIERFVEELEQVRKALGLENFYLYGQSWGAMLAIEYALAHQEHLKGLIISNMTASIDSYVRYANQLRNDFPLEIQNILKKYEDAGDFHAPEYEKIMFDIVYKKHLCRVLPWPDPLIRAFKHMNFEVYNEMQGPNEFVITGSMKYWNRWHDIAKITVPTLVMGAAYDTMDPKDILKMAELIPNASLSICNNGSHLALYDDQAHYFQDLINFLDAVESDELSKVSCS